MDETKEDKRLAAEYHLTERGFFVEYPTRPITLDTTPMDGSEFIHKSRLAEADLSYCKDLNVNSLTGSKSAGSSLRRWGRKRGKEFTELALKIKVEKPVLIKNFPKKMKTPKENDDRNWCIFCLGSKMFSKIYSEDLTTEKNRRGHLPTLSIVLHFSQEQIMMLLSYFFQWFKKVGLNDNMGRWIYALLAILEKPVDLIFLKELEAFHDHCEKIVPTSDDKLYKYLVYLLMSLLKHCFCVKGHTVGPDIISYAQTFKLQSY